MFILNWLYGVLFYQSKVLLVCFLAGLLALIIGGVIGYKLRQGGYVLAVGLLCVGANLLAFTWLQLPIVRAVVYLGATLCVCAFAYTIALVSIHIQLYITNRKKQRASIERAVCYTLPARENEYVRSRLQTVAQDVATDEERLNVSLMYARRTIDHLPIAKLSLTERLETERLTKLLLGYKYKQTYSTEDVRFLNEGFSRLMKIAAKYGVVIKD